MRELRGAGVVKVNHMPGEAPTQLTSLPRSSDARCLRSIVRSCLICQLVAVWMLRAHSDVVLACEGLPHEHMVRCGGYW